MLKKDKMSLKNEKNIGKTEFSVNLWWLKRAKINYLRAIIKDIHS